MIRRILLVATAITASAVLTACSDTTAPKNDPGGLPAADRQGNSKQVTVVATIKGRGTADMQDPIAAGKTVFSFSGSGSYPTARPRGTSSARTRFSALLRSAARWSILE